MHRLLNILSPNCTRPLTAIALLACALAACSGIRTYHGDHQTNLFITTDAEVRGWLSSVDAALDIYEMANGCDVHYQGTVALREPFVEVGVREGVAAYLVFRIDSFAFLTNTHSSMFYDVALYPDYGQVYDVNVTYRDNLYDVEVAERPRGEVEGQQLFLGAVERDCGSDNI